MANKGGSKTPFVTFAERKPSLLVISGRDAWEYPKISDQTQESERKCWVQPVSQVTV